MKSKEKFQNLNHEEAREVNGGIINLCNPPVAPVVWVTSFVARNTVKIIAGLLK